IAYNGQNGDPLNDRSVPTGHRPQRQRPYPCRRRPDRAARRLGPRAGARDAGDDQPDGGAALDAIENLLPAGHQSLGTHLDVGHYAATPVGMTLRGTAEVIKIDGRNVTFRVEAFDDRERVGDGTHTRVVVNVERFDARIQRKLKGEA